MAFFDTVDEKNHQCAMDNLYNSDAFFKEAYNHEKITDSWCYKESNRSNNAIIYTRLIEFKGGTGLD